MTAADNIKKGTTLAMSIAALGVVFGDIGTSPLYAFNVALQTITPGDKSQVLALASLIVWALIIIVTIKYIMFVMRADYKGEGGIFALFAILGKTKMPAVRFAIISVLLIAGASLLFGDGTITPAISVLSAIEGLKTIQPALDRFVVPATVLILLALFSVQHFGTGKLGRCFGYVMLLWFVSIGILGLIQVVRVPEVLLALRPWSGVQFIVRHPSLAIVVLGAVVLAVTGAEALYADLGHFGRPAISFAWHFIALPGLLLNYLGQAALVLHTPSLQSNPNLFYLLAPEGTIRMGMLILATLATVIASQALISGIFSLTSQAIDLDYLPHFAIFHTSSHTRGQIFMPAINWVLAAICLLLVVSFRSSDALSNAYGLAVTGTMLCTTVGFAFVLYYDKEWNIFGIIGLCGFLLVVESCFLISCSLKLISGGYVPVAIGLGMIAIMTTWRRGRTLIRQEIMSEEITPEQFGKTLKETSAQRVPGTIVFVGRRVDGIVTVAIAREYMRRVGVLPEKTVILSLATDWTNPWSAVRVMNVKEYEGGVTHVTASYGYMVIPNAPLIMGEAEEQVKDGHLLSSDDHTFYVLFREVIYEQSSHRMAAWRRKLFSWLSRNVRPAQNYLSIPPPQIVEFTCIVHF